MTARAHMREARGTAPRDRTGGYRRCAVTRRSLPRAAMIRFVIGPDRAIVADLDERLPGRGVWVSADADALARMASGREVARMLRAPVAVPADLCERVEQGLARRCAGLIGLARKAGSLVAGFEKVRGALKAGKAALLVEARDGAADGRAKLRALACDVPVADALTSAELGAALGRANTVHAAVTDPVIAAKIAREFARLKGVRGATTAPSGAGNASRIEWISNDGHNGRQG